MAGEFDPRMPLKKYLRRQAVVDVALRKVLREAARQARREVADLEGKRNISSRVRAAQLRLQEQQLRMWAGTQNIIEDGITGTADDVASVQSAFSRNLLSSIGVRPNSSLDRSLRATARNTVMNYLARQHHNFTLSERVYRNATVSSGKIARIIDNALLTGKSQRELAAEVFKFVNPSIPGGTSYAAMRLARTEMNNAFHQASRESAQANPFVEKVEWKLSSSHPRADVCDDLVGRYGPMDVPDKPHPQCFCFTTPVPMSHAALVRRFKAGEFDEWADVQLARSG